MSLRAQVVLIFVLTSVFVLLLAYWLGTSDIGGTFPWE